VFVLAAGIMFYLIIAGTRRRANSSLTTVEFAHVSYDETAEAVDLHWNLPDKPASAAPVVIVSAAWATGGWPDHTGRAPRLRPIFAARRVCKVRGPNWELRTGSFVWH
jgi:hypothetical protein